MLFCDAQMLVTLSYLAIGEGSGVAIVLSI